MRSAQASSPFSAMHASRAFRVSGQAQHGLHLGLASAAASVAAAATSTWGASEDMLDELDVIFRKWKKELKVLLLDSTRETLNKLKLLNYKLPEDNI